MQFPKKMAKKIYIKTKNTKELKINQQKSVLSGKTETKNNENTTKRKASDNIIGKGFDKRPENINKKGRPPKLVSGINAELSKQGFERVSPSQVSEAYETLLNLSEDKIKDYVTDKTVPMFFRIVAKQMLSSKGVEMIERMLDRAHGKATQKTESDIRINKIGKDLEREIGYE